VDLILEYAVGTSRCDLVGRLLRQLVAGVRVSDSRRARHRLPVDAPAAEGRAESGVAFLSPEAAIAYQAHLSHPTLAGIPVVFNLLAVPSRP